MSIAIAGICLANYLFSEKKEEKRGTNSINHSNSSGITNGMVQDTAGQADAIIVDAVNALRIKQLLQKLSAIDRNAVGAENEIQILKAEILKLLKSNRGGAKGIHGFIGETCQVHVSNIKAFINGEEPLYILLDDNSMTDYLRGMEIIQQKASQANGHLGLDAIKCHKIKYPEFIERGGKYQIPKDLYTKYDRLKNLPEDVAMKLRKEDLRLWKYIQSFAKDNPDIIIEPMELSYSDIQAGNIEDTIQQVEDRTEKAFEDQREKAYEGNKPSAGEFLKTCCITAVFEAIVCAVAIFVQTFKKRKKLSAFSKQDISNIFKEFIIGGGKGAIRGGIVYIVTNYWKISANLISGLVTALFAISHDISLFFKNKLSKAQFMMNSFFTVLETAASIGGGTLGKLILKKHPIIGTLAGSIIGSAAVGTIRRTVFA